MGELLRRGLAIPACPLALTAERRLDERRQRALVRYYAEAGAGGLAVGVHTTQFAIRDPAIGLFEPLLRLVAEELDRADRRGGDPLVRIAGVCGRTGQARGEAELAHDCGYHAALLSLAALGDASEEELIAHVRTVAEVIPLVGFYLQPAVGGRVLPFSFWRRFAEIENVVAIKIAPFNRYQTLDVVRAVVEAGRDDLALYTGNDDNIVIDLLTPFRFETNGKLKERRIVGGLLGHWAVWTRRAVELLDDCHRLSASGADAAVPAEMLRRNVEVTDANAAVFDAANGFAGCIAGIHEVLRRQGLLAGLWCLDPAETLGPGQAHEIDRVCRAYPHLTDDAFVREHLDRWLNG
ncbi:dihydrodipicolinate synthase family protein [Singulisphaera sp. GP187]|uniref:dihydrodipicolinate synthase family protein n=1 Tax=Singulisphaera sp. GP187 TaxID=1882752 RepID=UPI0009418FDD